MSLAQELNQIGEYGYIKFTDLIIGKKYKVISLSVYDSSLNNVNRKCLKVNIDGGYLILPERYDQKVNTINSSNVENLYIAYYGRQKGNRAEIRFSEQTEAEVEAEQQQQNQA